MMAQWVDVVEGMFCHGGKKSGDVLPWSNAAWTLPVILWPIVDFSNVPSRFSWFLMFLLEKGNEGEGSSGVILTFVLPCV